MFRHLPRVQRQPAPQKKCRRTGCFRENGSSSRFRIPMPGLFYRWHYEYLHPVDGLPFPALDLYGAARKPEPGCATSSARKDSLKTHRQCPLGRLGMLFDWMVVGQVLLRQSGACGTWVEAHAAAASVEVVHKSQIMHGSWLARRWNFFCSLKPRQSSF